jgi:hypothetical protein
MGIISILKSVSIGSFTNKKAWKKQPFALLEKDHKTLMAHKFILVEHMIHNVDSSMISTFKNAFDFFMIEPEKYDGASGDVELYKIGDYRYDIAAIIHDYLDAINFTHSFDNLIKADLTMAKVMKQLGDPSIHYDKRVGLLAIIRPLRFAISFKRRRKLPPTNKDLEDRITVYIYDFKINYWPFITYLTAGIALIVICATHPVVMKLYKIIF